MTPQEFKKLQLAAEIELDKIRKSEPSKFFVPNKGQEKALSVYAQPNGTDLEIPFINMFGGGNGTGKTTIMVEMLTGLSFGSRALNKDWLGKLFIFHKFDLLRMKTGKPLSWRIVCDAGSMTEDGPIYKEIRNWFPKGRYEISKGGKTYYSVIKCYDENGEVMSEIGVKTYGQDEQAHAGTTLNGILFDEPPPITVYSESIGRVRGGGFLSFFLTPLNMASWMDKQILKQVNGRTHTLSNASIWENCSDVPGMRGHLKREQIENLINEWKRINPAELDARVNGTFTHLSGALYKCYNEHAHISSPFAIPKDWPIYFVIDPHDARPPAMVWFAQSPTKSYAIAEWPTADYTQMDTTTLNIFHFVEAIRGIEGRLGREADYRICDPNKLNYEYPNTRLTVGQEYAKLGIKLVPSDDNLEIGHGRVSQALYYDETKELSAYNSPNFMVFSGLYNTNMALRNYGFKSGGKGGTSLSSRLDQTYKDFADCVRYYFMKLKAFSPVGDKKGGSYADKLRASRGGA